MKKLITEQTNHENVSLHMRGQVLSEMDHAYLNHWIGLPDPELFQLTAALAVLQAAKRSEREVELLVTVLLLIYHGLSIHENIDEANPTVEKYRQLRVLAGDYYSSKYFFLLAAGGKIDMIGVFAEAITSINEAKAEAYSLPLQQQTIEKYISNHEKIDGELLFVLSQHYFRDVPIISDIVRLLIRTHIWGNAYHRFNSNSTQERLSLLYLLDHATEEERKIILATSTVQDSKVISLHVKYGTASYLYSQFQSGIDTVKSLLTVQNSIEITEIFGEVLNYLNQTFLDPQRIAEER